jgi:hypothetical protein
MNIEVNNEALATGAEANCDNADTQCIDFPKTAALSVEGVANEWVAPEIANAYIAIADLIADQEEWLNGVHRTANERLYQLLQRCYHLYTLMASNKEQNEHLKDAIEKHIAGRKLAISKGTHTLNKIIKVVFGADRRRASAYCLALRVALSEKVEVADVPQFLRDAGGVEEVRRGQTNGGKPKTNKVEVAKQHTANVYLATLDEPAIASQLDCAAIGKQVVLLATQDVNGTLNINGVVQHDAVVNAALTVLYNNQHEAWAEQDKLNQAQSESAEIDDLINAAVDEIGNAADLAPAA